MLKNKTLSIVTILVLALAVVAMSCAPAAEPTKPAATEPAKPAATEPAKPAATEPAKPAATEPAKPAAAEVSFEADTYTNDEYGFSLKYPKAWIVRDKAGYAFYANDSDETTADTAFTAIAAKTDDIAGAAKAFLDESETFKKYNVKCDIVSQEKGTLADGKTPCTKAALHVTIIIYSINIYAVGAVKGDDTIMVIAYTFGTKTEKIQELCSSLAFK
ncbi:MAG: hypothetical protein JXA01_03185 [Dehalococcoidia bacterium]|nr:hypothetical protein [Dehalococcoidia bacterium]